MQSTVDWTKEVGIAAQLPSDRRLDDQQLADADRIAALPVPALPGAPEDFILRCMRTLTLLPSRQEDDLSGELRLALYRKHFGRYPEAAWSFLVEHATLECKFFPTPAECRAILERWNRTDGPHRAQQFAMTLANRERQARFDDIMARFREGQVSQQEVDGLPERWRRIAATQGYLREDGTYALRPVRRWEEQEGVAPVSDDANTPGRVGEAPSRMKGQDHERQPRARA